MPDSDPAQFVAAANEAENTQERLQLALSSLDARSQDILYHRWLNEDGTMTLQDLADKYQVSAERIRQLEKNAMQKLKKMMQA